MIEKAFSLSQSTEKTIEKVVMDDNVHYLHMLFPNGAGTPKHITNSNVYMSVVRGVLTLELGEQPPHEYAAPTLVKIPNETMMYAHNTHAECLELIVVKAPAPIA